MRCLFVIDMQNGFVTPGTRHIVPKIESLFDVKKYGRDSVRIFLACCE